MKQIQSAAVIGAGVMGANIAAHLANAGLQVILMDRSSLAPLNKNHLAHEALERIKKSTPPSLMHKSFLERITPAHTDDFSSLTHCDWIIEAVIEDVDIKKHLYKKIHDQCQHAIVSSNTSTIPLEKLIEGMPVSFQQRFFITHFFNPPRYMRLLEVVKGPQTDPVIYETLCQFAQKYLGKTLVECNDTPGFIANRMGLFWMQYAFKKAMDYGMTVEEVDGLMQALGCPKTGVFGLMDLVGLDLIPLMGQSLMKALPSSDLYHQAHVEPEFLAQIIAQGYTGRKGKGGFYRINNTQKESLNLKTGKYEPSKPYSSVQNLKELFEGPRGSYISDVMGTVLWYAAFLYDKVSDSIHAIDTAMKLGYNWTYGPFELMDQIGLTFLKTLWTKAGLTPPPVAEGTRFYTFDHKTLMMATSHQPKPIPQKGQLLLSDIKRTTPPLMQNASAALWDVGEGVVCFEITTKMNTIDASVLTSLRQALDIIHQHHKAMVIYNEAPHFSAGANLNHILECIEKKSWSLLNDFIILGQETYQALKYAPFPVVGAPSGMALGGGWELLLHCDAIQAHSELYGGLVEVKAGLIPAWGGCKETLLRLYDEKNPHKSFLKACEKIGSAHVSTSAMDDDLSCHITMNREWLLKDAKNLALRLVPGYKAPLPMTMTFDKDIKINPIIKDYQSNLSPQGQKDLGHLNKKILEEKDLLDLERLIFMDLACQEKTQSRIEHLLLGKSLKN